MDISVTDLSPEAQSTIQRLVAEGRFDNPDQALRAATEGLATLPELDDIRLACIHAIGDAALASGIAEDFTWDGFLEQMKAKYSRT